MASPRSRARAQTVQVPAAFARDFRYLVWYYDMTEAEAEEWRVLVRGNAQMMDYVATLTMALRRGYRQTAGNNYVRLNTWLVDNWLLPVSTYTSDY